MNMRELIDLVEASGESDFSINTTAIKNFSTSSGSGAMALAVFDNKKWGIVSIHREGKPDYWMVRMPNGKLVDVYGAFSADDIRTRFGNQIDIKPIGREDAFHNYQTNTTTPKIPVRAAIPYVRAVVTQAETGKNLFNLMRSQQAKQTTQQPVSNTTNQQLVRRSPIIGKKGLV